MPHDKIKAAARKRMAETGERYTVARRAVIAEHQQAGAAQAAAEPLAVPVRRRDPAEAAERIRAGYREHGIPDDIAEAMIEETLRGE